MPVPGQTPHRLLDLSDTADRDRSLALGLLTRFHDEVLAPTFRPDDLNPLSWLSDWLLADPRRLHAAVAVTDAGEPVAGLLCRWFPAGRTLLFAYLAARADTRRMELGTRLLHHSLEWIARLRPDIVVAEVEDPRTHPPADGQDPAARVQLYGRIGSRVLDMPHLPPRSRPGGARVPGMLLIGQPDACGALVTGEGGIGLPGPRLAGFLRDYYTVNEGGVPADAEVSDVIDEVAGRDVVPFRPVATVLPDPRAAVAV
jgi:hypothetical protein